MKTTLQFLDLNIHNSWYRMLEQHVDYWQRLTSVTATDVVMERQPQGKPGFRVRARLAVSGGDFHAEAIARTLKAALHTASQDLETQIQARKAQRLERRANNHPSMPVPNGGFVFGSIVPDQATQLALLLDPALMQATRTSETNVVCDTKL